MRWRAALSYLFAGAALFALGRARSPMIEDAARAGAPQLSASADEVLAAAARARGLDRDDPVVQRRLVGNMAFLDGDDAGAPALYDEALGLGLQRSDLVVQRRLAQRIRLALEADARAVEPSDEELRRFLDAQPGRFALPERVSVTQVFMRRGASAAAVQRTRQQLDAGVDPAELGEALPLPARLALATTQQIDAWLGTAVADAVHVAPLDVWIGPIMSPYGLHWLRVEARTPADVPPLAAVRAAVRDAWLEARAAAAVDAAVRRWRSEGVGVPFDARADAAASGGAS